MNRRELASGLAALVALSQLGGCRKRDRTSVLEGLVRDVVVGMAREVLDESREQRARLRTLLEAPSAAHRAAAQAAFKRATLAWKRAAAFRAGPFAASQAFQQAAFWPARPSSVDAVLASPEAIDQLRVQGLGVDAKGLYALEYLLFEREGIALEGTAPNAQRAREYALELAENVLGYAARVVSLLGDGQGYAKSLAAKGQHGVDELFGQAIDTLDIVLGKLARVERARAAQTPLLSAVEGLFSRTSLDIVRALLEGTHRLYLGGSHGGLTDLVSAVSEPIDDNVRRAFIDADASLAVLAQPLEVALADAPARYRRAVEAVERLKHVMKAELASALEG